MPYPLKFYLYLFVWGTFTVVIVRRYLHSYGLAVVLLFAVLASVVAIYLGRWLFGRKGL